MPRSIHKGPFVEASLMEKIQRMSQEHEKDRKSVV